MSDSMRGLSDTKQGDPRELPSDQPWADCKCDPPGSVGLFVWRGDRDWASCVACDGRVRRLTEDEKRC